MSGETRKVPAGWYLDAQDASMEQYWDGDQWTEQRRPKVGNDNDPTPSEPSASPLARQRWEYRIEQIPLQEKWFGKQREEFDRFLGVFNRIGSEAWELVSYQAMPMHGAITGAQKGIIFLAVFKRPGV